MASSPFSKKNQFIDSLHLSERDHLELLKRMREEEAAHRATDRRVERRVEYRINGGLILQVRHPGGSVANYLIHTRNISRHGMGFLHGSFMYSGTPCVVTLRRADNSITTVQGEVRRCRLVTGKIHEVGIHFQTPIDVGDFITTLLDEPEPEKPSVEMPKLCGRVLYIEDSVNDQELLKFQLRNLGLEVMTVSNGPEAMLHMSGAPFDVIITGVWLPGMTGPEIAMMLREKGHQGPILALTPDSREETRKQVLEWGCTALLIKPYHFEDLVGFIHKHSAQALGNLNNPDVITSLFWNNQAMRPLITAFLERLAQQLDDMEKQIAARANQPLLEKMCLELKGSAGGYGYPQISDAAQALFQLISSRAETAQLQAGYRALAKQCEKAIALLGQAHAA